MDISAVGDVPVGISLYQPQRIAPTVELVRGTCGDESPVAGLLEGVEVPVGILNVGTIDLVPLYGPRRVRLDHPCPFIVDRVLEVVACERVSSVGCLLCACNVQVADIAGWKIGLGKLCIPG